MLPGEESGLVVVDEQQSAKSRYERASYLSVNRLSKPDDAQLVPCPRTDTSGFNSGT